MKPSTAQLAMLTVTLLSQSESLLDDSDIFNRNFPQYRAKRIKALAQLALDTWDIASVMVGEREMDT
jgi:hypothetical protein